MLAMRKSWQKYSYKKKTVRTNLILTHLLNKQELVQSFFVVFPGEV